MFVIAVTLVGRMNERTKLAKLKLENPAHLMLAHYAANCTNNIQRMFSIALVIIGQVENKKVFKIKILIHFKGIPGRLDRRSLLSEPCRYHNSGQQWHS